MNRGRARLLDEKLLGVLLSATAVACSGAEPIPADTHVVTPPSSSAGGGAGGSPAGGPPTSMGGGIVLGGIGGGADAAAGSGGSGGGRVVATLPDGFVASEEGGYQLGGALDTTSGESGASGGSGGAVNANGTCGNILLAVVRDFQGADLAEGHPDFEANIEGSSATTGLVASSLGADRKPVYSSACEIGDLDLDPLQCPNGPQTTSSANFDQWYRNGTQNRPYLLSLFLQPGAGGSFAFESLHYFPLDGAGFMDLGMEYTGEAHNFNFTTEIHTQFRYRGGEKFSFQGDDDVWVFINGQLAVDLGGLHSMQSRTIDLDAQASALGLSLDMVYPLDLFHAERHTDGSTFRIETNLTFVDCGEDPRVVK